MFRATARGLLLTFPLVAFCGSARATLLTPVTLIDTPTAWQGYVDHTTPLTFGSTTVVLQGVNWSVSVEALGDDPVGTGITEMLILHFQHLVAPHASETAPGFLFSPGGNVFPAVPGGPELELSAYGGPVMSHGLDHLDLGTMLYSPIASETSRLSNEIGFYG